LKLKAKNVRVRGMPSFPRKCAEQGINKRQHSKNRALGREGKLGSFETVCVIILFCLASLTASPAQTFKTVLSFDGSDGAGPSNATLIQGVDGNFYGTTSGDGPNNNGTVFKITPEGKLTTLYAFCAQANCTDGAVPYAGVIQATDGDFYGTTYAGGTIGFGTVFKITSGGHLTTLHSFAGDDGSNPSAALVQASNGNFYGTTKFGGAGGPCNNGCGTVFEITASGKLTTLHSFLQGDGAWPTAAMIQAADGKLYGTSYAGGQGQQLCEDYGCGTAFKVTLVGSLTSLYSFCSVDSGGICADGNEVVAPLVQAASGDFYGTTLGGGQAGKITNHGTVFKLTAAGTLTTLYAFDGPDGQTPDAGLVQGTNGILYGTTTLGGSGVGCYDSGCGTIFMITPGGVLTNVYGFCLQSGCADGSVPSGALVQATSGTFYGMTGQGGTSGNCSTSGCGTVFSLGMGLGPFVETDPSIGEFGDSVIILGNDLTGATSVTFNGTVASFKVVSASEITTTVPTGATSGIVEVATPSRTLKSNKSFRVMGDGTP
jgi:uncharacterized repeat protein (TIGR03803 family)